MPTPVGDRLHPRCDMQCEVVLACRPPGLVQGQAGQVRHGVRRCEDLLLPGDQPARHEGQHEDDRAGDPRPFAAAPAAHGDHAALGRAGAVHSLGALALQAGLGVEELARPGLGADGSRLGRLPQQRGDLCQLGDVRGAEAVEGRRSDVVGWVQDQRLGRRERTGECRQAGFEPCRVQPGGGLGGGGAGQHVIERAECIVRRQRRSDAGHDRALSRVGDEGHRARERLVEHQGQRVDVGPAVQRLALGGLG